MIDRFMSCNSMFWTGQIWQRQLHMACLLLPVVASAEVFQAQVTSVPDGDTLWVQPVNGGAPRKLRLQGIDAPEICQNGGGASRAALQALTATATIVVELKYFDSYGRGLARIHVGQQNVGASMVRAGQAWSYRWHQSLGPYAAEEAVARQARLGLFSQATPELPRDFRKRHGSCHLP